MIGVEFFPLFRAEKVMIFFLLPDKPSRLASNKPPVLLYDAVDARIVISLFDLSSKVILIVSAIRSTLFIIDGSHASPGSETQTGRPSCVGVYPVIDILRVVIDGLDFLPRCLGVGIFFG